MRQAELAEEWDMLDRATKPELAAAALGFSVPTDGESDDWIPLMALEQIGACVGMIVREPALKVSREKAERDAYLERPTLHLAPLWRHPGKGEAGEPAMILPVWHARNLALPMLMFDRDGQNYLCDRENYMAQICDLVAIPLAGKDRPLSRTGHTPAVGEFKERDGRLTIWAGGLAWLMRYLGTARKLSAEYPVKMVPRAVMPFPLPSEFGALIIEPRGVEWRPTMLDCVVPRSVKQIAVPDSRGLARLVDAMQRRKERPPVYPTVIGPKENHP